MIKFHLLIIFSIFVIYVFSTQLYLCFSKRPRILLPCLILAGIHLLLVIAFQVIIIYSILKGSEDWILGWPIFFSFIDMPVILIILPLFQLIPSSFSNFWASWIIFTLFATLGTVQYFIIGLIGVKLANLLNKLSYSLKSLIKSKKGEIIKKIVILIISLFFITMGILFYNYYFVFNKIDKFEGYPGVEHITLLGPRFMVLRTTNGEQYRLSGFKTRLLKREFYKLRDHPPPWSVKIWGQIKGKYLLDRNYPNLIIKKIEGFDKGNAVGKVYIVNVSYQFKQKQKVYFKSTKTWGVYH